MPAFRYRATRAGGGVDQGVIEGADRRDALQRLAAMGLFPSSLESANGDGANGGGANVHSAARPRDVATPLGGGGDGTTAAVAASGETTTAGLRAAAKPQSQPHPQAVTPAASPLRGRVSRKEVTAFTRQMATLLEATIPIPIALESLNDEEENPALNQLLSELTVAVRGGSSLSEAMERYPRLFSKLYTSMIKVGEEAGALDTVMADLADLLESEDEMRGEVVGAVAYPCFILGLGVLTTFVLLAFVMPRLFGMLGEMTEVLPLPTRILLGASEFFQAYWIAIIAGLVVIAVGLRALIRTPAGALAWDKYKLRLPFVGRVFRSSALTRFTRTLGTLVRSGVSLLPALQIVENTVGNLLIARSIRQVADETRGGDSLATPLRKLGLFPATMIQMIAVGEETGRLDSMLLRVATIQERQMRGLSRTLISLMAPALILIVGALVGFMVIALLLPIFQMSQNIG